MAPHNSFLTESPAKRPANHSKGSWFDSHLMLEQGILSLCIYTHNYIVFFQNPKHFC